MLTRKHFKVFAETIKTAYENAENEKTRQELRAKAQEVASMCKSNNARFDYQKFFNACGIPQ